jgi:hypothetical protein
LQHRQLATRWTPCGGDCRSTAAQAPQYSTGTMCICFPGTVTGRCFCLITDHRHAVSFPVCTKYVLLRCPTLSIVTDVLPDGCGLKHRPAAAAVRLPPVLLPQGLPPLSAAHVRGWCCRLVASAVQGLGHQLHQDSARGSSAVCGVRPVAAASHKHRPKQWGRVAVVASAELLLLLLLLLLEPVFAVSAVLGVRGLWWSETAGAVVYGCCVSRCSFASKMQCVCTAAGCAVHVGYVCLRDQCETAKLVCLVLPVSASVGFRCGCC